jgi:hypothetical protein
MRPTVEPDDFATFRPQITTGLLAHAYFPAEAYSRYQPVNLGSNRYSFQLGLPTGLVFGPDDGSFAWLWWCRSTDRVP